MARVALTAACTAALVGLSSCVSPSPELAKSANGVPSSDRVIRGPPVQECLRGVKFRNDIEVSNAGFYEPSITYEMANLLRARAKLFGNRRGIELAADLRTYSIPLKGRNLFGKEVKPSYLCIFEASGRHLHFLDKISVNHGGKVQRTTYDAVVFGLMDGIAGLPF
ncbi:hypothetical protein ACQZ4Y_24160 [Rhizobium sp. L80/93]|uniref:hypothetical protein n=1 Tax=Rhizobium sp. L245/93 TaxID=2819998 RepID=UPI001ADCCC0B|nr:hypothetical protein [Rhizobium sp. L245/93]MBO9170858.1 hypothetical protein [Rhizobium sp. L245/93]